MKVVIVGTGYVGLVAGACFSQMGIEVCSLDIDETKVNALNKGKIHIHEPGLAELITKSLATKHISFSNDLAKINDAEAIIIAVGTPPKEDGSADISGVMAVASSIVKFATTNKTIIIKSTVPLGTAKKLKEYFVTTRPNLELDVVSNPEFLREGSAIQDFFQPDRIIIGTSNSKATELAKQLYSPITAKDIPIVFVSNQTAELIKYAANSYLAMRIAFINEIADLCEKVDADIGEVANGIGLDNRIGRHYLHAGPGYGGSCFPKDTKALVSCAKKLGAKQTIIESVIDANELRKIRMAGKIIHILHARGLKKIAILGLTFKANTDDMRESPSLTIIPLLLQAGIEIAAYDPSNSQEAAAMLSGITCHNSYQEALHKADAAVILTEWSEFKLITPNEFKQYLQQPLVIDLRNMFPVDYMKTNDIEYISVGR